MAAPYLDRMNEILADRRITSEEFGRLEEAIFAAGGVVDNDEFAVLADIHFPGANRRG